MYRQQLLISLLLISSFKGHLSQEVLNKDIDDVKAEIKKVQEEIRNLTTLLENLIEQTAKLAKAPPQPIELDENLNVVNVDAAYATDCEAALQQNQQKNGVYVLKPESNMSAFGAVCERHGGKVWTIIQRRQNGEVDFFRNWHDYKNGFGNLNGDFWLGLERIYRLLAGSTFELWLKMITLDNKDVSVRYSTFSIGDENTNYELNLDGFRNGASSENGLRDESGMEFSTFDKEHTHARCANKRRGGWWYQPICGWSNLNGVYRLSPEKHVSGLSWDGSSYAILKYVHMAIRPV